MSKRDGIWFALSGAMAWGGATLAYLGFAGRFFGTSPWQHGLNVAMAVLALALFFPISARVRRAQGEARALAALAFAAPGLIGSAGLALNAALLLPDLSPEALARYVALALGGAALVLTQAIGRPVKPA